MAFKKSRKKKPYISLPRLAEYSQANATRRTAIIKSLKEDSSFIKNWYYEVRPVFKKYIKSGYDNTVLDKSIIKIQKTIDDEPNTDTWEAVNGRNSIIALKALKKIDLPDLSGYEIITPKDKLEHIILDNVTVSIKPEVYIRNKKTNKIGAIKLSVIKDSKSHLNEEARVHGATLLKKAMLEQGFTEKQIDYKACFLIDVFGKECSSASKAFKNIVKGFELCCHEITSRWDSL